MKGAQLKISNAIEEMCRVIFALILREIKSRFGNQRLGYIWAILEPVLFVVVLSIVFSLRGRYSPQGLGLELFLVTGVVPYFLFRHIMAASVRALTANRQLLTYPQVQMNDIIFARALLEFATSVVVFVVILTLIHLIKIDRVAIDFPLGVLAGFFMMALFGLGLGLILSSLFPIFPSVQPMSEALLGRPLFFTSGAFFSAEIMPEKAREILLWNPLFHVIEYIRGAFFPGIESLYFDPQYTLTFMIVLLFMGLLMQRALHRYALSLT